MLFSDQNTEIILNQETDLKDIVNYLKGFRFQNSDSKEIHENFCLYIFLIGCFKISKLSFPVKIISRQSPDFTLIKLNKKKEIGIEHTRATLESYKIALSESGRKWP